MQSIQSIRSFIRTSIVLATAWVAADSALACGGSHRGHQSGGGWSTWGEPQRRGGGFGIEIGPGPQQGPPTYGNGLIGPPTAACAEKARMYAELNQLFRLRAQVDAGRRVVQYGRDNRLHVRNPHLKWWQKATQDDGSTDNYMTAAQEVDRQVSLQFVDSRISATQTRIGELQYECPD